MSLIGILIIIVGFVLKLDTIAVVVSAGVITGLVSNMSITEILTTLGSHLSIIVLHVCLCSHSQL